MRAGGSYQIVFGKKLQTFAASTLKVDIPKVFAPFKEIFNKKALYVYLHEMVPEAKTPKITKIAGSLYKIFKKRYQFYLENDYIDF